LPVRSKLRLFNIVIGTDLPVHRLFAYIENFTDTTPERDRPSVIAVGFPISRYCLAILGRRKRYYAKYLPMALPKFMIILELIPSNFNTL
jgi:hypothetical protein